MTTGFVKYGVADMDGVFAPGNAGITTGFQINNLGNQDLGNRFAPLSLGMQAAGTGFVRVSTDLNAYLAAIGTVAAGPMWPIGQGYQVGVNGIAMSANGVGVLTGRQAWQFQNINNSVSNEALYPNNIADFFAPCPGGAGVPNTNNYTPLGGFATGGNYGLQAGMVLRFATTTDNLPGSGIIDISVGAATEQSVYWTPIHSGGLNFCAATFPYYHDVHNVRGFLPAPGTYYAGTTAYVYWARPNYWAVRLASAFCCNQGDGTLNVIRVAVTRIA